MNVEKKGVLNLVLTDSENENQGAMPKLVIHIGMHKTGSSSIQQSLNNNLNNDNYKYFNLLNHPNQSLAIKLLFLDSPSTDSQIAARGTTPDVIKLRKEQMKLAIIDQLAGNAKEFILSGEGIVKLSENELLKLKSFFSEFFSDIAVVAYVRPPKAFIQSAFQQRLKGPHFPNLIDDVTPDYRERFEKFDKVFGKEKVTLLKFNPNTFPGGDVVLDFCERLGIPFDKANSIKVNESMSLEAVALLYVYRKYGSDYGTGENVHKIMNYIIKELDKIGHKKFKISPSLIQPVLIRINGDVEWMEARLGESLYESIQDDPDAIQQECQLESIALDAVKALESIVESKYIPSGNDSDTIEGVVAVVDGLRLMAEDQLGLHQKVSEEINNIIIKKELKMNPVIAQLVNNLKVELPDANEKLLKRVAIETLNQVAVLIDTSDENVVRIPKLGNFRKREIEKDGEITTRILFKPVKQKE